ncbi:hypothetical protein [Paenibacillus andongensis]|uniref:hypothetical protein n=1 Tax=Paenibacillus andongensis TaxID=2975482 RepID=UPI0021BAD0B0|nr:hypothetical protein [Paenibacillus andongensis]
MKAGQPTQSEVELENHILKLKTDTLSLIVSGESLARILHVIEKYCCYLLGVDGFSVIPEVIV